MKNRNIYFYQRSFYLKSKILRFILFAGLAFMILPGLFSCYSSSAIKGTPINEVKVSEDLRKPVNYALTQEQKDEIEAMSRVQENAVFNTIRGIPEYRIDIRRSIAQFAHSRSRLDKKRVRSRQHRSLFS